jgi:hypothetical protein
MYLKSDTIKAIFGVDGGEKILYFIRNYIIPQEHSYCYYLRKQVRHFETTTNSGHEGTNNGIKAGPLCVLPQHGIDKSVKIQVDTDSNKFELLQRLMANDLFGTATWSNSPTVNELTLPAEHMLKSAVHESEKYASWRTSVGKWLVVRSVERDVHSLIPCFHRVYTVTSHEFDNTVCLLCDCNYFECNGMVCPHMVHVKKYYGGNPNISHHDISVRWWKAYMYILMKSDRDCSDAEKTIKGKLRALSANDCKGPKFIPRKDDHTFSPFHRVYKCGEHSNADFKNANETTIESLFHKASLIDRVINYTRDEVLIALRNTKRTVPASMSQEVHLPDFCDEFVDNFAGEFSDDDNDIDDGLIECTTVSPDCIDFGSRALHQEDIPISDHYNAYDRIVPRTKELLSLVAASKNPEDWCGVLVEEALDNIISIAKAKIASEKPPPKGMVVSACPVGKVQKTNVSAWHP